VYITMDKDKRGEWRWVAKAENHEPLAVSSEGYVHKADCEAAITIIKWQAADAMVLDVTQSPPARVLI
jgi:uncharacterized protein